MRTTYAAVIFALACAGELKADGTAERPVANPVVDAHTLRHKVLCGYQGWFRCPGDGTDEGWLHWSRDSRQVTPDSLTVEMWPDMSEYEESERY
ncbi:MAG TPA: hypothetical protein VFQ26_00665, partial [Nitrospiraceae bacterium]|nr:hypothetical protein [Nitrospiraceae bacterium]